jgi:hypothetical protein
MKLTEDEYATFKAEALRGYNEMMIKQGGSVVNSLTLTCDDCDFRLCCEFSGDLYNIDGDCLAIK